VGSSVEISGFTDYAAGIRRRDIRKDGKENWFEKKNRSIRGKLQKTTTRSLRWGRPQTPPRIRSLLKFNDLCEKISGTGTLVLVCAINFHYQGFLKLVLRYLYKQVT